MVPTTGCAPKQDVLKPRYLQNIVPLGDQAIPEFLYQLTQMLMKENANVIEWSNSDGRIIVHDPPKVAKDVLGKYFRHSNYASFQRQLNYFGFRKVCIKTRGRLAPCSYTNDSVTDFRSLLFIKRKTGKSKSIQSPKSPLKRKADLTYSDSDIESSKNKRLCRDDTASFSTVSIPETHSSDILSTCPLVSQLDIIPDKVVSEGQYEDTPKQLPEGLLMDILSPEEYKYQSTNPFNRRFFLPESFGEDLTETSNSDTDHFSRLIHSLNHTLPETVDEDAMKQKSQQDHSTEESSTKFDAAGFCASLNQIIQSKTLLQVHDDTFQIERQKKSIFPKLNPQGSACPPISNNSILDIDKGKLIRDDGLVFGLEPTPLRDMNFNVPSMYSL